jgi:hypothetical protein
MGNRETVQSDIKLRESIEARRAQSYHDELARKGMEEAARKKEFLRQIQRDNALKSEQNNLERREQKMKEDLAERKMQEEKLRNDVKRLSMI